MKPFYKPNSNYYEKVVFVAGDRVITQSRNKNLPSDFEIAKLPFNLDIDLNLQMAN